MSLEIPESDWRQFKKVHPILLERFCARTLDELRAIAVSNEGTAHDRYLRLYALTKKRDKELANGFDDFRRSTAVMQLLILRHMGLLTDEELSGFSAQTQQQIRGIEAFGRGES